LIQNTSKIECFKCRKFRRKASEYKNKTENVPESKSAMDKIEVDDCFAIFDKFFDDVKIL